jgi:hypothetical protein
MPISQMTEQDCKTEVVPNLCKFGINFGYTLLLSNSVEVNMPILTTKK